MPESSINPLINAGIAGAFAVFALMLYDRFNKYLEKRDETFLKYLESERVQRMQIMQEAQRIMTELLELVGRIDSNARETNKRLAGLSQPTKPRKEQGIGGQDSQQYK